MRPGRIVRRPAPGRLSTPPSSSREPPWRGRSAPSRSGRRTTIPAIWRTASRSGPRPGPSCRPCRASSWWSSAKRSSALASKATGFPIAKIAAKLALGYHLDEIPNDITRLTPASFEPTIDYIVVKYPRWNFEKFPQADRTLTTQMKSVGEAMAIGRTFKEAFLKGVRSLELGRSGLLFAPSTADDEDDGALRKRLAVPSDRRMWDLFRALGRGWSVEQLNE